LIWINAEGPKKNKRFLATAMLITSLPLATQANAQQDTKREAAMEKCRVAARKAYPAEIQDIAVGGLQRTEE
jgi:hypothetical protein